jgi:hypothetical protein
MRESSRVESTNKMIVWRGKKNHRGNDAGGPGIKVPSNSHIVSGVCSA